jgi:hypothetical protein
MPDEFVLDFIVNFLPDRNLFESLKRPAREQSDRERTAA